ncbi:MAG TPA: membrane dipeptidase [Nitriliruptorales bacterium]
MATRAEPTVVEASDEHARRLHAESLVIDTLAGFGPRLYTPQALARMEHMIERGRSPAEIVAALEGQKYRDLLSGQVPQFWRDWDEAGVDAVSVTVGGFGERFFTSQNAVRDLARMSAVFDLLADRLVMVRAADDIEAARGTGKKAVILNFQNTTHLDDDLDNLEVFHDLGIRVMTLTYNTRNSVGDGCTTRTRAGLSHFGVEVVRAMNEIGIVVDVAHCCEATAMDAIETSDLPVAVTHSFCGDLSGHDRGMSDDVIRAIRETGGYFGVCVVPFFLTDQPHATLDHWLDHVDHAVALAGVEHVGIGTDWHREFPAPLVELLNPQMRQVGFEERHRADWGASLDGFASWHHWPNLTAALVRRGYRDDEVRGLLGENFLRLFRRYAPGRAGSR